VLAPKLDAASIGIDDFDGGWPRLLGCLDLSRRAVVECVRIHSALRRRMRERGATLVELTASPQVQSERLLARGEASEVVAERIGPRPPGYDDDLRSDLTVDTGDRDPEQVAALIAEHLEPESDRLMSPTPVTNFRLGLGW